MEHLVVDCSGAIGQEAVARMYEEAVEAARAGDVERAGNIARQAERAALDAKPVPTEYRRPHTDEDEAQRKADEKHHAEVVAPMMLRAERNARLAASDWTQAPDAPVDKEAWAAYRQKLRDLPSHADPLDPAWPVPPA